MMKNRSFSRVVHTSMGRLVLLYLVGLLFMAAMVLIRELYLGIFRGLDGAFAKEVLRNSLIFITVWTGSRLVFLGLNRLVPYRHYPFAALGLQLLAVSLYSYAAIQVYIYYLQGVVDSNVPGRERHFTLMLTFWLFNIFINLLLEIRKMLVEWQRSVREAEALKKEVVQAQLNVLQHQVNPHFLFNLLNTLSSLVYKDAGQADMFIQQMAKVYRYVLENNEKESVPLADELTFIKSFLYLLTIRYKSALEVSLEVDEHTKGSIVPVSLQMLIENAVKHNVASRKRKLHIRIGVENGCVVVQNTLQPRSSSDTSLGLGLHNIKSRYKSLTDQPVTATTTGEHFVVRLPILKTNEE